MDEAQQDSLREQLRTVGLNRYEALVYLGLVTDQTAKVAEISRRTGVPQPKVYQALDALVQKGFCAVGSDAINRYRPLAPHVALESYLAGLRKDQEAARSLADALEALLIAGQGRELWAPPIEIVKGSRQVQRLLVEHVSSARHEILLFGKPPQLPALDVAQAMWERADDGCELRFVFEPEYLDGPDSGGESEEELGLYRTITAERRVVDHLPTKMVIVDRAIALLSISRAGGESFLALAMRHDGFVEHLLASFELYWNDSRPLDA